jgi:hypothetical protein
MNGEQQVNPGNTTPKALAEDRCPEVLRYMRDDLARLRTEKIASRQHDQY